MSKEQILQAFVALASELTPSLTPRKMVVAGGAAVVLLSSARLLLSRLPEIGDREAVWAAVEPYVVPDRELKARYAFDDLWEAQNADS